MNFLKVTEAEYLKDYKIKIAFNDGLTGILDLKEKIFTDHRSIYKQLQDKNYFKNFKKNKWTIEWENGFEPAPEFLFDLTKIALEPSYPGQIKSKAKI